MSMLSFYGWVWWHNSVIPALRRLRQCDCEFKSQPGFIVRSCFKNKDKIKKKS
jgi:hypothetical protein